MRTALTRDVWESLNSTWNELAQIKPENITADRLPEFLEWVKQRAMGFRGALLGTMLRTDNYYFSQLGNFIERADNTARILDVKYFILLPRPSDVGSDLDMQQWAQVLRSVSAHRAYRWFYKDSRYKPWLVSEFLILKEEMPRSLLFTYQLDKPGAGRPGRTLWQPLCLPRDCDGNPWPAEKRQHGADLPEWPA